MTDQFESIMTVVTRHIGNPSHSANVQPLVLSGFRDRLYPPSDFGVIAVRVLERPIDEVLQIGEDERLCDSTRVDNRVRPFKVISHCSKPAEWIYVMKCCGIQALACDPCHEKH